MQTLGTKEDQIRDLFGGSDSEDLDDLNDINPFEEDEDMPSVQKRPLSGSESDSNKLYTKQRSNLPKIKKKHPIDPNEPKKERKKKKKLDIDPGENKRELTPESARRDEVKKDMDAAMQRINSRKSRKTDIPDEAEIDEIMIRIVKNMTDAAERDQEFNKLRQPAVAKLKLLPAVVEQLNKSQFAEQFLDNNLLDGMKLWLEPLRGDASLPSLDIQRAMFKGLQQLPIQTANLRESHIGKIVMFYSKCDRVLPEVKKIVNELLEKWMRPLINKTSNYRDRSIKEKDFNPHRRNSEGFEDSAPAARSNASRPINANKVQIPDRNSGFDFAPKSNLPAFVPAGHETSKATIDRIKKLNSKMMNSKRKAK